MTMMTYDLVTDGLAAATISVQQLNHVVRHADSLARDSDLIDTGPPSIGRCRRKRL